MKVGFTGTRKGMTKAQLRAVRSFLRERMGEIEEAHHGDCMGADDDFDTIIEGFRTLDGAKIKKVIHPPYNDKARAFCSTYSSDEMREKKSYLERNHDIVDECDLLVSTPGQTEEILRSGTWATIRYARGNTSVKMIYIIYPSGGAMSINFE